MFDCKSDDLKLRFIYWTILLVLVINITIGLILSPTWMDMEPGVPNMSFEVICFVFQCIFFSNVYFFYLTNIICLLFYMKTICVY